MPSKKNNSILEIIEFIMWIYIITGSLILIYSIILKIIGYSPTTDSIILIMLSVILAGLIGGGIRLGVHIGKSNEFMKNSDKKFEALARDFKRHIENHKK